MHEWRENVWTEGKIMYGWREKQYEWIQIKDKYELFASKRE